jgi:hypothetical protein
MKPVVAALQQAELHALLAAGLSEVAAFEQECHEFQRGSNAEHLEQAASRAQAERAALQAELDGHKAEVCWRWLPAVQHSQQRRGRKWC